MAMSEKRNPKAAAIVDRELSGGGSQFEQHSRETEGLIVRIEEVLEGLNEHRSSLKDMALSLIPSSKDETSRTSIRR
jgi:ferritin-like metal-binding protein YciE